MPREFIQENCMKSIQTKRSPILLGQGTSTRILEQREGVL